MHTSLIIKAQQDITVMLLTISFCIFLVMMIGFVYLWGRSATCASLGLYELQQFFVQFNPKLDRNHNGIACEL